MPPIKIRSMAELLKITNTVKIPRKKIKSSKEKIVRPSEHAEQVKLFEWAKDNERIYPELWLFHSIPNGAGTPYARYKNKQTGKTFAFSKERAKLVAEGLKSGVPDTHLPVPRGIYSSLYIEMKRRPNKSSDQQLVWHEKLRKFGNYVQVCWSFEEARDLLLKYLNLKEGEEID